MNNEQTQTNSDDPSGPGWRDVEPDEILQTGDMFEAWCYTTYPGLRAAEGGGGPYRRRIEPQQAINPDDPSGDGWRDVEPDEILQHGDMFPNGGQWERTGNPGIKAKHGRGGTYRRRIEQQQAKPEPQLTPDDPSGEGWRDVEVGEVLRETDMFRDNYNVWTFTENTGVTVREGWERKYRRRIEPQQPEPQAINPDDPSGDGWRDLGLDEPIEQGDVYTPDGYNWLESDSIGRRPIEFPNRLEYPHLRYRRRIEPQQPSDSDSETMEDMRRRLAACEVLLAEAERGGQQVNAELQQLREQVATLTQQLMAERDSGMIALQQLQEQVATLTQERDRLQSWLQEHHKTGQQSAVKKLERWLRPVLEVVAEHPEDASPLAVAVLGYLPRIASRLIEE